MLNNRTILVVETAQYQQDVIINSQSRQGYQAIGAATGVQALQQAIISKPSLMILDLMLPDMNGLDVCSRIKQDSRLQVMGIILTSINDGSEDIISGLDMGADDYIPKPFSPRVLLARVQAVLHRLGLKEHK